MTKVVIYTTPTCPYCIKAKNLLEKHDLAYQEINVAGNDELREEMIEKAGGRRTVPQIFIDGEHIGGCDDLMTKYSSRACPQLNEF